MSVAAVTDPSKCYFIDDNRRNIDAAVELGWAHCVHFRELGLEHVEGGKVQKISNAHEIRENGVNKHGFTVISQLSELRDVWPEIFKAD